MSILKKYFEDVDDKYVRCIPCGVDKNQLISLSGNTSNLKRHLQRAHPDSYHDYLNDDNRRKPLPKTYSTVSMENLNLDKPSRSRFRARFFEDADETHWRCKPCGPDVNKLIARSGNTSNLKRHLMHVHLELYQEYLKGENKTLTIPKGHASAKRFKRESEAAYHEIPQTPYVNRELSYTCRACLTIDPTKTFQSLLEEPMRSSFWECTAVEVMEGEEGLPVVLCSLCVARCEAAKYFRDMVHDNDDKLKENQTIYVTTDSMITDDTGVVLETMEQQDEDPDHIEITMGNDDDGSEQFSVVGKNEEEEEEEGGNFYETVAEEVVVDEVIVVDYKPEMEEHVAQAPVSATIVEVKVPVLPSPKRTVLKRKIGHISDKQEYLTCEFCEEDFPNRTLMANHYQSAHPTDVYNCPECNKSFISAQTWRKHACPVSSNKYSCEFCNEIFISRCSLKKHTDEHLGKTKLYTCTHCGHQFKQKGNMDAHMARHSDERKFECKECGKSFKEKREVVRHSQLVHSNERPHQCNQCDKAFGLKYMLERHLRTHTGEKPFPCTFENCDQKLSSQHALKSHLLLHTNEKPHNCETCGAQFRLKAALAQHIKDEEH